MISLSTQLKAKRERKIAAMPSARVFGELMRGTSLRRQDALLRYHGKSMAPEQINAIFASYTVDFSKLKGNYFTDAQLQVADRLFERDNANIIAHLKKFFPFFSSAESTRKRPSGWSE